MEEPKVVKQRIVVPNLFETLTRVWKENHGAFRTFYNTLKNCTKGFLVNIITMSILFEP